MENLELLDEHLTPISTSHLISSSERSFIEANTLPLSLEDVRSQHVIPVFIKDNEPVISHVDFIETFQSVVSAVYKNETVLQPAIRMSHPIKGRIPEAKHKAAKDLQDHEKTIYYERMAFTVEIPSITAFVDGQQLSLMVGGVKAYNLDNLYSKKGTEEHFKIFIGFENKVCTNLCIWTDGLTCDLRVRSQKQLADNIEQLVSSYNPVIHHKQLLDLTDQSLSGQQFALLMGRARLYTYLPNQLKRHIPELLYNDTQLGTISRDYYRDKSFCRNEDGSLSLWKLYNLFTGVNRNSYIDAFVARSQNAYLFTKQLSDGLNGGSANWFLT